MFLFERLVEKTSANRMMRWVDDVFAASPAWQEASDRVGDAAEGAFRQGFRTPSVPSRMKNRKDLQNRILSEGRARQPKPFSNPDDLAFYEQSLRNSRMKSRALGDMDVQRLRGPVGPLPG